MKPGRTRIKLAKLLSEHFCRPVYAEDLDPAQGYWRSSPYADVVRWTGTVRINSGTNLYLSSWDKMTECVKKGIVVDKEKEHAYHYQVWPRP